VKENREPVEPDNVFWHWQTVYSDWVANSLDLYRDWRDMLTEQLFFGIYNQPWLQALLGLRATDGPPRRNPGQEPDHLALIARQKEDLLAKMDQGGPHEAVLRGLIYVRLPEAKADERGFEMIRRIRAEHHENSPLSEFKEAFREQFFMILLNDRQAVAAIPKLLEGHQDQGPKLFDMIKKIATAGDPLGKEAEKRLKEIEELFLPKKTGTPKKADAKIQAVAG
jgi:hypothetical protein